MTKANRGGTKPCEIFRLKGIVASVFKNEGSGEKPPYYAVSLQRIYMQNHEFKTTSSFSRDHIPVARLLMNKAYEYVLKAEDADRKESESNGKD